MKTKLLLIICVVSLCGTIYAQTTPDLKWKPEHIVKQTNASQFRFSPDGNMVIWVKSRASDKKNKFVSDIFLTRLNIREKGKYQTTQLTRSDDSDYSPLFSNDGKTIYFLSSRQEGKKLWAMSVFGGEPYEVHEFKTGISDINILKNNTLILVSGEQKTYQEQQLKERKDDVIVVEDTANRKPQRIFSFDLESKKINRLTDNHYPVASYSVSKNGKFLITSHHITPNYSANPSKYPLYFLWDLTQNTKKQILQNEYQTPYNFQFLPDNSGFYFTAIKSSDPQFGGAGINLLYFYNLKTDKITPINLQHAWGMSDNSMAQIVQNNLVIPLANGTNDKLYFFDKSKNWERTPIATADMGNQVWISEISEDGKQLIFEHSTASKPRQYFVGKLSISKKGVSLIEVEKLTHLNKNLDDLPFAKSEIFRWKGAKNEAVEGVLFYPKDYEKGKKYPLILSIHGGPSAVTQNRWGDGWSTFPHLWAEKNAFVLKPNYHGSSNYGLEFLESIKGGNYNDLETVDLFNAVQELITKGMADPEKIGTVGWSNGAILTTELTLRYPDLFKVACPGAGDVNWTSDYGTCRFGVAFDQSYIGGAPWDDTEGKIYNEKYVLKSPLFEIEKIKTPTLIFHGSADRAVPRDQGWEYYRGLQQVGKAPVRFLWFPNQPHGLQKISHQLRKISEEIKWVDTYLFENKQPENQTFNEKSPLAFLLKKSTLKMQNGRYGIWENDVLIPETAHTKKDSIQIGVFEITNAQFNSLDTAFNFLAGQENYPALVSEIQAQKYIQLLSEKTGKKYRFPNAEEAKKLHEKALKIAPKENTLAYWAGYAISYDEVAEFRQKLAEIGQDKTILLKPVGSWNSTKIGEAKIFDLGGNVARMDLEPRITPMNKMLA